MKLFTHRVFAAGTAGYVADSFSLPLLEVILVMVMASLMQDIIDWASHEAVYARGRVIFRRTPLFHSPLGAVLAALIFTGLLLVFTGAYRERLLAYTLTMLTASFSHLLLDSFTEKGVFIGKRRIFKERVFSNNNPMLNALFTLIGLFLIVAVIS